MRADEGRVTARPLIVWDIDRTLLDAGPVTGEVFLEAIRSRYPQAQLPSAAESTGSTDTAVVAASLRALGLSDRETRSAIAPVIGRIEHGFLRQQARMRDEGECCPGVPAVLEKLAEAGAVQTVLTGNTRKNALLKLETFGLRHALRTEIGAYGDEAEDRDHLLPLVLKRAADVLGRSPDPFRTWVVGDTPRDLRAASPGARCLLVATGRYPLAELASLGADEVLPDLADVAHVVRLLTAPPTNS